MVCPHCDCNQNTWRVRLGFPNRLDNGYRCRSCGEFFYRGQSVRKEASKPVRWVVGGLALTGFGFFLASVTLYSAEVMWVAIAFVCAALLVGMVNGYETSTVANVPGYQRNRDRWANIGSMVFWVSIVGSYILRYLQANEAIQTLMSVVGFLAVAVSIYGAKWMFPEESLAPDQH